MKRISILSLAYSAVLFCNWKVTDGLNPKCLLNISCFKNKDSNQIENIILGIKHGPASTQLYPTQNVFIPKSAQDRICNHAGNMKPDGTEATWFKIRRNNVSKIMK